MTRHVLGNACFAFIADAKIASERDALATGIETQRPHFQWHCLQRNPRGNGAVAGQRPVVLVRVGRCNAAARFLVEALVVVKAHSTHLQQFRRDARQPLPHHKTCHQRTLLPQVHHLQERAVVGAALLQWAALGVQLDGQPRYLAPVVSQRGRRQDLLQLDATIAAKRLDLFRKQGVGGIEVRPKGGVVRQSG